MKKFSKEALCRQISWDELADSSIDQLILQGLNEDLKGIGLKETPTQTGDPSSEIFPHSKLGKANIVAREACVLSGLPLVQRILNQLDANMYFKSESSDGTTLEKGTLIGTVEGSARMLLQAERLILNFLQYMSGIATLTKAYSKRLEPSKTRLLDTRKTIPAHRLLSKYAFTCGGGYNHRLGLFDRIMLKDNHWAIFGASVQEDIRQTLTQLRQKYSRLPIQVEVDHLEQIPIALEAGVDCILLDNFSIEALHSAVVLIGDQAATEASGGIELKDLDILKSIGLDFISTGAPIHQSQWVDIGLDWL